MTSNTSLIIDRAYPVLTNPPHLFSTLSVLLMNLMKEQNFVLLPCVTSCFPLFPTVFIIRRPTKNAYSIDLTVGLALHLSKINAGQFLLQ